MFSAPKSIRLLAGLLVVSFYGCGAADNVTGPGAITSAMEAPAMAAAPLVVEDICDEIGLVIYEQCGENDPEDPAYNPCHNYWLKTTVYENDYHLTLTSEELTALVNCVQVWVYVPQIEEDEGRLGTKLDYHNVP